MTQAANTALTVRVQAKGGMFLGPDSHNGAIITVSNGASILAPPTFTDNGDSGTRSPTYVPAASPYPIVTPGSPPAEYWVVANATTVKSTPSFYLSAPALLKVEARVPLPAAQGDQLATAEVWVVPGQQSTSVPGIVVEIPGLWVQPELVVLGGLVNLKTKVTMMCGCEVNLGSPWIPADFHVEAEILQDGQRCVASVPLTFNFNSQFTGQYSSLAAGDYVAVITGRQISTGNSGTAKMAFRIAPANA